MPKQYDMSFGLRYVFTPIFYFLILTLQYPPIYCYPANAGPQYPNNNQHRLTTHNAPQYRPTKINEGQQSPTKPMATSTGQQGRELAVMGMHPDNMMCHLGSGMSFTYVFYPFTNYILIYYNISAIIWPMQAHSSPMTTNAGLQHTMHPNTGQQGPTKTNESHGNKCRATKEGASGDRNAPRQYDMSFVLLNFFLLAFLVGSLCAVEIQSML